MGTVAHGRVAAGIAVTIAALGVVTAFVAANHVRLESGTATPPAHHRVGQMLEPHRYAVALPSVRVDGDAAALTLLPQDAPAAAVPADDAQPLAARTAPVVPAAARPMGKLESAAPGIAHTVQRTQAIAAPLTAPLDGVTPAPAPQPVGPDDDLARTVGMS